MAQSLARLWTHLIFSTKDRFPFLTDKSIRREMHAYLAAMFRNYDCETLIVGGVEEHTHSLFALSRNHSIATVVKEAKRTSSGWVKEKSPKLASFHWQAGYGAFSVSQSNLKDVIAYSERFQRCIFVCRCVPGLKQPWAGISERPRRSDGCPSAAVAVPRGGGAVGAAGAGALTATRLSLYP